MATVVIINGRHEGEWYTLGAKPMVFGRDDKLLAEIIDPRVSHNHLEIVQNAQNGKFYATDLNSRNGTKINGQRIHDTTLLKEGDVIQIGHTMLVFTGIDFEDPEQTEAFVEQAKRRVSPTLDKIADREQYTEAASIFAKIFRKKQ